MFIEKNCSVKGQAKEKGIENLLADCIGMVQVWVEAELLSVISGVETCKWRNQVRCHFS